MGRHYIRRKRIKSAEYNDPKPNSAHKNRTSKQSKLNPSNQPRNNDSPSSSEVTESSHHQDRAKQKLQ